MFWPCFETKLGDVCRVPNFCELNENAVISIREYESNFNAINVGRDLEVWVMGGVDVFLNEREMF